MKFPDLINFCDETLLVSFSFGRHMTGNFRRVMTLIDFNLKRELLHNKVKVKALGGIS
jgi:hypothetical protein